MSTPGIEPGLPGTSSAAENPSQATIRARSAAGGTNGYAGIPACSAFRREAGDGADKRRQHLPAARPADGSLAEQHDRGDFFPGGR